MKTIQTTVKAPQRASRKELLVRLVYWIPLAVVLWVLGVLWVFAWVINLGSVIIRGMRSASISSFIKRTIDYRYKMEAYYSFITDERPPILPE